MKLLICTQAYDPNDPVLGFFARWVEEFAKHCEQVTVICLRTAEFERPGNVRVFGLGGGGKVVRSVKFLRLICRLRNEYDRVLVHMNPEYMLLGGICWRLRGKKPAMWYAHGAVDLKLRVATRLADTILTSTPEGFRVNSNKVRVLGQGIDTDFFTPGQGPRGEWWLSVGRLSKVKHHDRAIRMAHEAGKELRIAGEGPERERLQALAHTLGARVQFLGGLNQTQLREQYRTAAMLIHTSETGSLDKVLPEAVACGLPVRTTNPAYKVFETAGPEYVRGHHSLQKLIPAILAALA